MSIIINYRTVGRWKENTYLLQSGNEAWLVDPGDEFEVLNEMVNNQHCNLRGIINTHGHFDHIGAVAAFQQHYNIPFYIHRSDKQLVRQGNLYRKLAGENTSFQTPVINEFINEDSEFEVGNHKITIVTTPGHTNGSVCFKINNALISGDLFFEDSIGRTDLPGGNRELLLKSIDQILTDFRGYTIYPGHGQPFLLSENVIERIKQQL